MTLPKIGSMAPAFTLPNQDGKDVSLSDYTGKHVVLWFYPRAYGNNWTKQARGFRARAQDFISKDTVVLGITFGSKEELKKWKKELDLKSDLLCDADKSVSLAYGAAETNEKERPSRIGIVIGPNGKVIYSYDVDDAEGHAARALAEVLQ